MREDGMVRGACRVESTTSLALRYRVNSTVQKTDKALPTRRLMLPPPCQRPPEAEIPAMRFAVVLKILIKANLLLSLRSYAPGETSAQV